MIVGFIGFGEAGSTIAGGLAEAGVDRIFAFDIAAEGPRTAAEVAAVVARLTGQLAEPKLRGMSGSGGWPESSTA